MAIIMVQKVGSPSVCKTSGPGFSELDQCAPNPAFRDSMGDASAAMEFSTAERERLKSELDGVPSRQSVTAVLEHRHINPHINIGWPEMPSGLVPKLTALAQKVARRLLRWYINPIVEQQNRLNNLVSMAFVEQAEQIDALTLELASCRRNIQTLALRRPFATPWQMLSTPELPIEGSGAEMTSSESRTWEPTNLALIQDLLVATLRKQGVEGRSGLVVHLGCGSGDLVEIASLLGMDACGVEPDEDAAGRARSMHRQVVGCDPAEFIRSLPSGSVQGAILSEDCWTEFSADAASGDLGMLTAKLAPGAFVVVGPIPDRAGHLQEGLLRIGLACSSVLEAVGLTSLQLRMSAGSANCRPSAIVVGYFPDVVECRGPTDSSPSV